MLHSLGRWASARGTSLHSWTRRLAVAALMGRQRPTGSAGPMVYRGRMAFLPRAHLCSQGGMTQQASHMAMAVDHLYPPTGPDDAPQFVDVHGKLSTVLEGHLDENDKKKDDSANGPWDKKVPPSMLRAALWNVGAIAKASRTCVRVSRSNFSSVKAGRRITGGTCRRHSRRRPVWRSS